MRSLANALRWSSVQLRAPETHAYFDAINKSSHKKNSTRLLTSFSGTTWSWRNLKIKGILKKIRWEKTDNVDILSALYCTAIVRRNPFAGCHGARTIGHDVRTITFQNGYARKRERMAENSRQRTAYFRVYRTFLKLKKCVIMTIWMPWTKFRELTDIPCLAKRLPRIRGAVGINRNGHWNSASTVNTSPCWWGTYVVIDKFSLYWCPPVVEGHAEVELLALLKRWRRLWDWWRASFTRGRVFGR